MFWWQILYTHMCMCVEHMCSTHTYVCVWNTCVQHTHVFHTFVSRRIRKTWSDVLSASSTCWGVTTFYSLLFQGHFCTDPGVTSLLGSLLWWSGVTFVLIRGYFSIDLGSFLYWSGVTYVLIWGHLKWPLYDQPIILFKQRISSNLLVFSSILFTHYFCMLNSLK